MEAPEDLQAGLSGHEVSRHDVLPRLQGEDQAGAPAPSIWMVLGPKW